MTKTKSLKHIIDSLSPDQVAKAAPHLLKLERARQQTERDTDLVRAVIRVLKRPVHAHLADELRTLIMGGACRQRSDY